MLKPARCLKALMPKILSKVIEKPVAVYLVFVKI